MSFNRVNEISLGFKLREVQNNPRLIQFNSPLLNNPGEKKIKNEPWGPKKWKHQTQISQAVGHLKNLIIKKKPAKVTPQF